MMDGWYLRQRLDTLGGWSLLRLGNILCFNRLSWASFMEMDSMGGFFHFFFSSLSALRFFPLSRPPPTLVLPVTRRPPSSS